MVRIDSYLRGLDGSFTTIDSVAEPLSDQDYIEGAIELDVDGVRIVDREMWDYVDQLWAYRCDMTKNLVETGHGSTYLPDQPLELSFERTGGDRIMLMSTPSQGLRKAVAQEFELVDALRAGAVRFFDKLGEVGPGQRSVDALERIDYAWRQAHFAHDR